MTYIDGFVIPVPTANKQKFIDHANRADAVFLEEGASRILECWQDNVAKGHTTDFFGAVDAKDDEAVAFSWVEYPSKEMREELHQRMTGQMETDERLNRETNPMPFDGMRMVYGGFTPIVDEGAPVDGGYVQGFLVPVPEGNKDAYVTAALAMWDIMKDYGAARVVEAWQDNVSHGKQTDFFRAVKAEDGEIVVFSFIEWPSREVCDASHDNMMQDERMQQFMAENPEIQPPFDGKRMIYGGFTPVVELTRENVGA